MRSRRFVLVMTGLCLLTLTAANAFARVEAPGKSAVGTWKLDARRSSYGNMPAPKFEQLVVTSDTPDSLQWNIKSITSDGKSYISSYNGPTDGEEHPMMSSEGASSVAYTRTASGVSWVAKDKNGTVIETGSSQLSPDGNTLTLRGTEEGPKGKTNFISVFERTQ